MSTDTTETTNATLRTCEMKGCTNQTATHLDTPEHGEVPLCEHHRSWWDDVDGAEVVDR